jgi:hypothetical protein
VGSNPTSSSNKKVDMNNELALIRSYLEDAHRIAAKWQQDVYAVEGDSALYRKLNAYLTPNLQHWITGAQAGNIKDLEETLSKKS